MSTVNPLSCCHFLTNFNWGFCTPILFSFHLKFRSLDCMNLILEKSFMDLWWHFLPGFIFLFSTARVFQFFTSFMLLPGIFWSYFAGSTWLVINPSFSLLVVCFPSEVCLCLSPPFANYSAVLHGTSVFFAQTTEVNNVMNLYQEIVPSCFAGELEPLF